PVLSQPCPIPRSLRLDYKNDLPVRLDISLGRADATQGLSLGSEHVQTIGLELHGVVDRLGNDQRMNLFDVTVGWAVAFEFRNSVANCLIRDGNTGAEGLMRREFQALTGTHKFDCNDL